MGLIKSIISAENKTLRDLIINLRNSIAHFDIEIKSNNDDFLIDNIVFKDEERIIAEFKSNELLPFLQCYADWIKSNLNNYAQDKTY